MQHLAALRCTTTHCVSKWSFSSVILNNNANLAMKRSNEFREISNIHLGHTSGNVSPLTKAPTSRVAPKRLQFGQYNPKSTLEYIQRSQISDIRVISKAIKNCAKNCALKECLALVKYSFNNPNVKRDRPFYGIVFDSFASMKKINVVYPVYFNKMQSIDKLEPDIITTTALLKGCMDYGDIALADDIYANTIRKFNLSLDAPTYTCLITTYGKGGDINRAQALFKELISQCEVKIDKAHFGALLNAYASNMSGIDGNSIKNKQLLQKMIDLKTVGESKKFNIKFDIIQYRLILSAYLKVGIPVEVIRLCHELLSENKVKFDKSICHVLQIANLQLLEQEEKDELKRKKYFNNIVNILPRRITENGDTIADINVNVMFKGLLYYYTPNRWNEAVQLADIWKMRYNRGHWNTTKECIDIHVMSIVEGIFWLRYAFCKEKNRILNENENERNNFQIIVGKGNHVSPGVKYGNNRKSLKDCVICELKSWNPSLNATVDPYNHGCLLIKHKDIAQFYKANPNIDATFLNGDTNVNKQHYTRDESIVL